MVLHLLQLSPPQSRGASQGGAGLQVSQTPGLGNLHGILQRHPENYVVTPVPGRHITIDILSATALRQRAREVDVGDGRVLCEIALHYVERDDT